MQEQNYLVIKYASPKGIQTEIQTFIGNDDRKTNKEAMTSETANIKCTETQQNEHVPKQQLLISLKTQLEEINQKILVKERRLKRYLHSVMQFK